MESVSAAAEQGTARPSDGIGNTVVMEEPIFGDQAKVQSPSETHDPTQGPTSQLETSDKDVQVGKAQNVSSIPNIVVVPPPESQSPSRSLENRPGRKRKPSPYIYSPLPERPGAIRLLRVRASTIQTQDIVCNIVVPNPGRLIQYEALSWCWGNQPRTATIYIKKRLSWFTARYAMKVSPELFMALRFLRSSRKDRYLWIDAICINQEDLVEKNQQVGMMDSIYANARQVRVWLGEASKTSSLAFKFIKEEVLQFPKSETLFSNVGAADKWMAVFEVMQRPWFNRRWVNGQLQLSINQC